MSLPQLLRERNHGPDCKEAADRIEELEASIVIAHTAIANLHEAINTERARADKANAAWNQAIAAHNAAVSEQERLERDLAILATRVLNLVAALGRILQDNGLNSDNAEQARNALNKECHG